MRDTFHSFLLEKIFMTDSNTSRRLSAASGWYWFRDAATAVGRKPLNLLAVTMVYLLIMGFLSAIPYAGIVFAALFMPFGTAFIGRSTRTALQGGDPRLSELKNVFIDPVVRQNLMRIGFVYGFILITVNALYGLMAADSIALCKIDANDRLDWASVQANIPWDAIVAVTVIYIPGLMAVWFAPLLASEKRMSWGKAVFYSFFGCLRNIIPVILLVLLVGAMIVAFGLLASALISALGSTDAAVTFVIMPLAFLMLTLVYAVYWPMYASLFEDIR